MAKFKKLLMLCTALMMTASIAAFASCGDKKEDSSPDISESTPTEDTSSDNSSSAGGDDTTDDVVYYEEIIAGGNGSLSGKAFKDNFGTLTLTIPEAGTYGIYTEEDNVSFGAEGSTDGWNDFMTEYTFNAEAGELTLATYVGNLWEDAEITYNYYLYKMTPLVIEEMTGEAEIASNLRAPVTFAAPAAGEYIITAKQQLRWFNTTSKSEDGVLSTAFVITAAEAGNIDFYVMLDDFAQDKLVFTWEVLSITDKALSTGENTVDLYAGVYREVTFTATEAGAYSLTVTSDSYDFQTGIYGYNEEWDSMGWLKGGAEATYNFSMAAGETKTLHIFYDGYNVNWEAGPATIEATATISALETADPSALTVGDNVIAATEEGVQATFTAEVAGSYSIDDDYNNSMWFEDSVEYGYSAKEVTLAAGESVSFTIKYDGLITISIEKMPDTIAINVGENTINVPAETAYLSFIGAEMNATYSLSFNGAQVTIIEDKGWMTTEIFSGSEFTYNPYVDYTITSKTGEAIENFAITVTFIRSDEGGDDIGGGEETNTPLVLGENDLLVTVTNYYCAGVNVTFTAIDEGDYILKVADGEENASVSLFEGDSIDLPYTFTLAAGASISFNVATTAIMTATEDTINLILEKVATTPAEPVEDKVTIAVDKNELTIGAGYYLTNSNTLTLNGEYTFDWNVFVDNEETADVNDTVAVDDSFITVLVNGAEVTSGTKLTYAEDTVVTIIIKSSDIAKNVYVSLTVTKTPEQVKPDNEWTNNY